MSLWFCKRLILPSKHFQHHNPMVTFPNCHIISPNRKLSKQKLSLRHTLLYRSVNSSSCSTLSSSLFRKFTALNIILTDPRRNWHEKTVKKKPRRHSLISPIIAEVSHFRGAFFYRRSALLRTRGETPTLADVTAPRKRRFEYRHVPTSVAENVHVNGIAIRCCRVNFFAARLFV